MTQLHAKGFFSLCTSQSIDRTAKERFAMLFFAFFLKSTFFLIVCPINMKPVGNPKSCRASGSVLLCACECEVVQGRGSPLGTVHRFRQWPVLQSGFSHLCMPSFVFSSHWSDCFSLKLSWPNYISSFEVWLSYVEASQVNMSILAAFWSCLYLICLCGDGVAALMRVSSGFTEEVFGDSAIFCMVHMIRESLVSGGVLGSVAQGKTSLVGTFSF